MADHDESLADAPLFLLITIRGMPLHNFRDSDPVSPKFYYSKHVFFSHLVYQ